jgi:hypothetical protein
VVATTASATGSSKAEQTFILMARDAPLVSSRGAKGRRLGPYHSASGNLRTAACAIRGINRLKREEPHPPPD